MHKYRSHLTVTNFRIVFRNRIWDLNRSASFPDYRRILWQANQQKAQRNISLHGVPYPGPGSYDQLPLEHDLHFRLLPVTVLSSRIGESSVFHSLVHSFRKAENNHSCAFSMNHQ